jgi:multidrug efflux pump subunit AcrA (membrane-fusion protein)
VEALGGAMLTGTVARVGTLASSSIGRPLDDKRFDLVIELDESHPALRPDMTARADITVAIRDDVLLVPVTAIVDDGARFVVRVARGRRVEMRPVTVGASNDDAAEIVSGLQEGERVILAGPPRENSAMAAPAVVPAPVSHVLAPR